MKRLTCLLLAALALQPAARVAAGTPEAAPTSIDQAAELQSRGDLAAALAAWDKAIAQAETAGDRHEQARLLAYRGTVLLQLERLDEAEQTLLAGVQLAETIDDPVAEAANRNNLGYVLQQQGQAAQARMQYERVIALARLTDNPALLAKAAQSIAEIQLSQAGGSGAEIYLDQAWQASQQWPDSSARAMFMLRNARTLQLMAGAPVVKAQRPELLQAAAVRLLEAAKTADAVGDVRAASWAYGYLGELYLDGERYDQAFTLTQQALSRIRSVYAPEIAYRWQWQLGRLYLARGEREAAMDAYRRAANSLQTVRAEFATGDSRFAAELRADAGVVLLELADLLLQESESVQDADSRQALLLEARQTVELVKAAELQNYFGDDCVAAVRERIKDIDASIVPGTAVLYPVMLQDRLELLLSVADGLVKYRVEVGREELVSSVHRFRALLEKRTTRQYMRQSLQLYTWLIEPLEKELARHGIDTLVVVPDSALRAIPLAALHDGDDFLIRRYVVAMTPSLRLTDPRPIRRENISLLLNGLTESVQGFPPLVHVSSEIAAIEELYGGTVLEDETFRKAAVEQQLTQNQYSIVHFATHGKFAGQVSDSFILTYDGRMNMDDLEEFVGVSWFRKDRPVELLTLSACQTAAGDDTAALGLASVAIKAGARSALASLWSISDEASSELVASFYSRLRDPQMSKAQALQQAQVAFLDDLRYRHPSYWAPFLLIGNWL